MRILAVTIDYLANTGEYGLDKAIGRITVE